MMNSLRNSLHPKESNFRSVLLACSVVSLNVILILGLVLLMLLFGGILSHLPWILAIGGLFMVGSGYLWWKYVKRRGKKLRDILKDPILEGRSVEVSFLGGLASIRFGRAQGPPAITQGSQETAKRLLAPGVDRSEQLANLGRLLKQDLITIDEFLEAKKELMGK